MKTIRHNSKKLNSIWENTKDGKVYNQGNYFNGGIISIASIQKIYEQCRFAKLWEMGNGEYHMNVDSSEWFEFKSN